MARLRAKEKLFELINDMNTTIEMEHGGGLDDAYMTLRDRKRRSAFADPDATSAFADPNNPSAFIPDRFPVSSNKGGGLPMIYRDNGGTTIPKERMINDQPHQLSYINPQEAGLLQALGGSGRRVNGIPTYDIGEEFDWSSLDTTAGGTEDERDTGEVAYFSSPTDAPTTTTQASTTGGAGADLPDWAVVPDEKGNLGVVGPKGEVQIQLNEDLEPGYYREPGFFDRLFGTKTDKRGQIFDKDETLRGQSYDRYMKDFEEHIPRTLVPYWNALKDRGMTNEEARSMLANAASTPGGLAGLQSAYSSGYSYGGAMGTLQDVLERGTMKSLGINELLKEKKRIEKEDKEFRENYLGYDKDISNIIGEEIPKEQAEEIVGSGFINSIGDILGLKKGEANILDKDSINQIETKANELGFEYKTPSAFGEKVASLVTSLLPSKASIPFSILQNLLPNKSVGTITKDDLTFSLNEDGSLTFIEDIASLNYDEGNEATQQRRRPVQQKAPSTPAADPAKTSMAALLARRPDPTKRLDTLANLQEKYKKIYGRPFETGIG